MKEQSFGIELESPKKSLFSETQFEKEIEERWGTFRLNTSKKFVQALH